MTYNQASAMNSVNQSKNKVHSMVEKEDDEALSLLGGQRDAESTLNMMLKKQKGKKKVQ